MAKPTQTPRPKRPRRVGIREALRQAIADHQHKLTVYHEAGHAAMVFFYGKMVLEHINMKPTRSRVARVLHNAGVNPLLVCPIAKLDDQWASHERARVAEGLMVCFAGPAVECAIDNVRKLSFDQWFQEILDRWKSGERDQGSDFDCACELALALYGDESEQWIEFMREVASWSNEVITNPRMWAIVEALAKPLMKTKSIMGGYRAWSIMQTAWGGVDWPLVRLDDKWQQRLMTPGDLDWWMSRQQQIAE